MKQERSRLWFRTLRAWAPGEDIATLADTRRYDAISIISYTPLTLPSSFRVKRKKIINIYVTDEPAVILKRFRRSTRQEIKKTYHIPELTFVLEDTALDETYRLYCDFEYAQGRTPWRKDSFATVKLFNAYYNGELISAIPCYDLYPYLQVRAMSSRRFVNDRHMQKIVSYATRRLLYELCIYAHERGYTFVGLGSINYETEQKRNVSQFKRFFGGVVEDEYEYIYESALFRVMARLAAMKAMLQRLVKRIRT